MAVALHQVTALGRASLARLTARQLTAALAVIGFLAAVAAVWAGGRIGTVSATTPLSTWFGILTRDGVASGGYSPGWILLTSLLVLGLLWLVAIRVHASAGSREAPVWWIAGAWSVPFALGPPLFSSDVYTYAAQGIMVQHGFDPYQVGPSALGYVPSVAAVDPLWRSVPSPYGPVATQLEHFAAFVSGGSPLGAVVVLRVFAVFAVLAIGLLAAALAGEHRALALSLTVLNPLLLLQVVSAAHFEGAMCAFLLGALLAAERRRWTLAIVLACLAGSVKAPAFVAVLAIVVVHSAVRHGRAAWRMAARDLSIAAVTTGALSVTVSNGFGWIDALRTPTLGYTRWAPTSLIANLLRLIVPPASFDDVNTAARDVALLAAGCLVVYLLATARRRPLNQSVGVGLIAVGLLSPVVYPWYLLWGMVCLMPTTRRPSRDWLVLGALLATVASTLGLPAQTENMLVLVTAVAGALVVIPLTLRMTTVRPHWPHHHAVAEKSASASATARVRPAPD
jgi:hypothetical protein